MGNGQQPEIVVFEKSGNQNRGFELHLCLRDIVKDLLLLEDKPIEITAGPVSLLKT